MSSMESESLTQESTKFPSDVKKWTKTNAKPLMALILMQVCKYFQHQNFPYFVVKEIICRGGSFIYTKLDGTQNTWDTSENIPNKLWITNVVETRGQYISQIIPKIAVCEISKLLMNDKNISFEDFYVLTSSGKITHLNLSKLNIWAQDGKILSLEDIFSCVPNIQKLYYVERLPFETRKYTKDGVAKLDLKIFSSADKKKYYSFGYLQNKKRYQCRGCDKIYAKLKNNPRGETYLEMKATAPHACKPLHY